MRTNFNWSRNVPSKDNISTIYIASPNQYGEFDRDITRTELTHSLCQYNTINELRHRKHILRTLLIFSITSIPFIIMFYNLFIGVWK